MRSVIRFWPVRIGLLSSLVALGVFTAAGAGQKNGHKTGKFEGPKANAGYATHSKQGSVNVLTFSDDFKIPDTPAPHWQVVDSKGNVYLLNQLKIKGDRINKTIKVPSYVPDIAKVQIWCSFAETLLGEASFETPLK
jgi:hypothetical protein